MSMLTLAPASVASSVLRQTVDVAPPLTNESTCVQPGTPFGPVQAAVAALVNTSSAVSPACAVPGTVTCLVFVAPGTEWLAPTNARLLDGGSVTVTLALVDELAPRSSVTVSDTV